MKLIPFLVPSNMWGFNARNVGKQNWEIIKTIERYHSGNTCTICGANHTHNLRDLHTHEFWVYDYTTNVAKIDAIKTVCKMCHEIIHLGRTMANASPNSPYFAMLNDHYHKVNGLPYDEVGLIKAYAFALTELHKMKKITWQTDLSIIGKYGVPIPEIQIINKPCYKDDDEY